MSDKRIREEYLKAAYKRHPNIGRLRISLEGLPAVYIDEDQYGGKSREGQSLFGVYFDDRRGPYEAFLWINEELSKSYVQWHHQAHEDIETCRRIWAPLVNDSDNPDGSNLKQGTDCSSVLQKVKEYILATGRKL